VQVLGAERHLPERPFETVPDMMERRWAEGLQTPRLMLLPSGEDLANEAAAFHRRNAEHLARWEPPTSIDLGSEQAQRTRLAEFAAAAASGTALHWWLQPNQAPSILVGHVSLMNIAAGPSLHRWRLEGSECLHCTNRVRRLKPENFHRAVGWRLRPP